MAMSLKLSRTKAYNPSAKEQCRSEPTFGKRVGTAANV